MRTRFVVALAATAVLAMLFTIPARAATATATQRPAQARASASWLDNRALDWAETRTGAPYVWGGNGPWGFDCSGLVVWAFQHVGIYLPRTTYEMLGSYHLHWIPLSQARRGDLLFYGSGHVEFATMWHDVSFGAHSWGQPVGWITWGWGWAPTAAYTVS